MKTIWLNENNNKNLILFFNGWGMDENAIKHLDCRDFDVLAVCDYRIIDDKLYDFNFSKYEKKYLISWSMGVYVSNLFKDILDSFDKKTAVAGTTKIIDDAFGIPKRIYNLTIKNFNNKSAELFIKNMFSNNFVIKINRNTEELKEELISIQNLKINNEIKYDKAIVPKFDKIVPYKNQINFWQNMKTEIKELEKGHYIFDEYKNWQDIIC